ncbi:membrane protein insertion efficiency factor YidD [Candidatus Kirkpatrickella diaphorinae]|uniref:Putative membrane protein insertion efficiency factor n=1 Tax=Candidatus Kirkpatrickella diaphorinae TaxID=2984322 RepID=A0ABY6GHY7_9PROT|nr:membrane protein insertion efficiency factor YidD [Candidatus Kirkpatrickella diaphorinae]UYH50470.1 membrane protein insertion efficiency factor YidD [Candidatus Kirkpatrickella diaphorinae]
MSFPSRFKFRPGTLVVKGLVALIKFYQYAISPSLGANCRFEPSCSVYARTALERHGLQKGIILAVGRILRCNRLCRGGYDPVPEVKKGSA